MWQRSNGTIGCAEANGASDVLQPKENHHPQHGLFAHSSYCFSHSKPPGQCDGSRLQANFACTSIQLRETCLCRHQNKFVKHACLLLGMLCAPAYAWCATCSQKQAAEANHATSVASQGMQARTVPHQRFHRSLTLWNYVASVRLSLLRLHPATPESKARSPSAAPSKHVTCKHDHIEDLPRARRKACRVKPRARTAKSHRRSAFRAFISCRKPALANCGKVQNHSGNARKPPQTGFALTGGDACRPPPLNPVRPLKNPPKTGRAQRRRTRTLDGALGSDHELDRRRSARTTLRRR